MEKKYYYKAMSKDMKCRDFQFKVGETYTIDSKELELCSNKVFHFCERLEDTISYYNNPTDRHFVIEVLGNIITDYEKSGSNKIRIVRALYSTNINILGELAKENNREIRKKLAKNPNTPVYILEELAKDKSRDVRFYVAENTNTPLDILEELVKEEYWIVRCAVAGNPNTPIHILAKLSKDKTDFIREQAQKRLKEITQ